MNEEYVVFSRQKIRIFSVKRILMNYYMDPGSGNYPFGSESGYRIRFLGKQIIILILPKKIKFSKKSNLDLIYSKKKNLILKQNNKFFKKKSKLKDTFFAMACFCTFTVYVLDPDPDSYVCIGSTFYDTNPDPRIRNRLTDLFL